MTAVWADFRRFVRGLPPKWSNNPPRRIGAKFEPFLRGFERGGSVSKLREDNADISKQGREDMRV